MLDQADLQRKVFSKEIEDRQEAAEALGTIFGQIYDKDLAWHYVQRLSKDENCGVRRRAAETIRLLFDQAPDKDQAWQDLHRLAWDIDWFVRGSAANAIGGIFHLIPNQEQAWRDIHKLTKDNDWFVRESAAKILGIIFAYTPNKDKAWQDLVRLTRDKDRNVQQTAVNIMMMIINKNPDKIQTWKEIYRLVQDEEKDIRKKAMDALVIAFSQTPDKNQAWNDLYKLTQHMDDYIRWKALEVLITSFSQVPDKDQAWLDLHSLTENENWEVRWRAVEAIGISFSYISNKDLAWQDIHELVHNEELYERSNLAKILGLIFNQVPNKDEAWQDILTLIHDKNRYVRWCAAESLAVASIDTTNKDQACKDLYKLASDEDSYIRMFAYHSLGKISVFKGTQSDNHGDLKKELETAINYFEKASKEQIPFNPAQFCNHFYRAYFFITFQDAKDDEIQKYLTEAKAAIGGSRSKDELFIVVENLAKALRESQRLKNRSFQEVASELNAYRWYCEKAAEHMVAVEDRTPVAFRLLRKCNPIIDERIQITIKEIQEKAEQIYRITHEESADYEKLGIEINRSARSLSFENINRTQRCVSRITSQLKEFCRLLPEEKRDLVCGAVEEIGLAIEFPDKLDKIELALTYVSSAIETSLQSQMTIETILKALEEKGDQNQQFKELLDRLEDVIFELQQGQINDLALEKNVDKIAEYIEDPELNIKNRLVCTIPLIPILLTYQGIIEYQSGINLLASWNKLISNLRS